MLCGHRVLLDRTVLCERPDVRVPDFDLVIDWKAYRFFARHSSMADIEQSAARAAKCPCCSRNMRAGWANTRRAAVVAGRLVDELRTRRERPWNAPGQAIAARVDSNPTPAQGRALEAKE